MDAASGGALVHRNPRQVSRMGLDRITLVKICNDSGIIEPYSPVLIGIFGISPPCGLNASQEVGNKWQSTSPGLVRQSRKLDAVVDGEFPNNINLTSIFSKVIGDKISDGSNGDLYMQCMMKFTADPVQK